MRCNHTCDGAHGVGSMRVYSGAARRARVLPRRCAPAAPSPTAPALRPPQRRPRLRCDAARAAQRRRPPAVRVGGRRDRGARHRHPVCRRAEDRVGFYLEGRKVGAEAVSVLRLGRAPASSASASRVTTRGCCRRAPCMPQPPSRRPSRRVRPMCISSTRISAPACVDQSVRLLQSELDALHYAVPLTGVFDEGTGQRADRIPQDDRPRTDRICGHAGVRAARTRRRRASTCATPATAATSRRT